MIEDYRPTGYGEAEQKGASCGQGALAAFLERSVMEMGELLGWKPTSPYRMNVGLENSIGKEQYGLTLLGRDDCFETLEATLRDHDAIILMMFTGGCDLPEQDQAEILVRGRTRDENPWLYCSHWITYGGNKKLVYDVNSVHNADDCESWGSGVYYPKPHWTTYDDWKTKVVPLLFGKVKEELEHIKPKGINIDKLDGGFVWLISFIRIYCIE